MCNINNERNEADKATVQSADKDRTLGLDM